MALMDVLGDMAVAGAPALFTSVFGGGESTSKTTQTPASQWSQGQLALMKKLSQVSLDQAGGAAPSYPGQMSVPTLPSEQKYLNQAATWQPWSESATAQGTTRQQALDRALNQVPYDVGPEYAEQFFKESIYNPALKTFTEETLPLLKEQYAKNFWSGAREDSSRKAITDFGLGMASQRADLMYKEEQAKRTAIETARVQSETEGRNYLETLRTAGETERGVEESRVMGELQRWLMGEEVDGVYSPMYNPAMQMALQILGISIPTKFLTNDPFNPEADASSAYGSTLSNTFGSSPNGSDSSDKAREMAAQGIDVQSIATTLGITREDVVNMLGSALLGPLGPIASKLVNKGWDASKNGGGGLSGGQGQSPGGGLEGGYGGFGSDHSSDAGIW